MQRKDKWRLAASIAPPAVLLLVAVGVACSDVHGPGARPDEWASATVLAMEVRSEVRYLKDGAVIGTQSQTARGSAVVLRGFDPVGSQNAALRRSNRPLIRHHKGADGKVRSLAVVLNENRLPGMVYSFENGVIQTVVSSAYQRRGAGYVRTKARATVFKDGKPLLQVDQSATPSETAMQSTRGLLRGTVRALGDVASVFLPTPLYAAETSAGCFSEWLTYVAAAAGLAVAIAAAQTCGTVPPACIAAGVALLAALDKWNIALDKYLECDLAKAKAPSESGGAGGDGAEDEDLGAAAMASGASLQDTINQFIQSAVESGNYACGSSGCIYYAAS